MAGSRNQSFDDRDSGHIDYQGNWSRQGTFNATNTGQTGTLALSNDPNATVTFAIAFYYYGMKKARTRFGVCIDCNPKDRHFEIVDAANRTDDGKNPPVLLYSQRFSPPGVHEVILRNERDPDTPNNNLLFTVDRFEIEVPAADSQPREVPIGAIVGGTVGGVVGILAIGVIAFFFWWRKKTRRRIRERVGDGGFDPSPITYEPPKPTPMTQMQSTTTTAGRKSRAPQNTPLQVLSSPSLSESGLASTSSRPEIPQREVDAGPMDDHRQNNDHDQLLPPEYEHVFESGGGSAPDTHSRPRAKR
ncbi:hypothetical protein AGABI1DRAFT_107814 [Agaricus bisporus var. burnettii JB137-S8]|uniref:Uncharacterized protein n=1 Tax=Agaricus bisporus var. burnettii (strain JB137-S8 / ATCC MYA-4627 / FGSC 10392) TaxID=597362 RepID=K5X586_AGABU|nr:uncharacterized protein AGABI1DRAFT_107814 [Agaricus bisporus var. burnettii JB137-S8]EKM78067.1 hypothetical protein AGABI1DRAFT_107814 [Agaricus bisporus var. burnettii JB137-S8]